MKKIFTILIVSSALTAQAQEQKSLNDQADIYYSKYDYARAASMYERIAAKRKDKTKTVVLERLANSYREMNNYSKAAEWYSKLLTRSDAPADARLYYADMLKSQGKYAEAKAAYGQVTSFPLLQNRMEGCDRAEEWMQNPTDAAIRNVKRLNTSYSDWGATHYPGGIVFMSDTLYKKQLDNDSRFNRNKYLWTNRSFYKLYLADTVNYGAVYIEDMSPVFNKYRYHAGPVVFTDDYRQAYYTLTFADRKIAGKVKEGKPPVLYGHRRLQLFQASIDSSGKWRDVAAFPYNNPDKFSVGHAALSKDGNIIYFTSDMPGGQGGTDIWYSERQSDGKWGIPVNCGPGINTADDEEFATLAPDGGLYFSSKGWVGMGGFDIFHVTGSKTEWGTPENLRYPTNSPGDDFYFVSGDNGVTYFASNRPGGKGDDDIYMITSPGTYTSHIVPPALVIPFTGVTCMNACIYIYNKKRDMGWCFLGEPGREINLTLEKDTAYEIRITYPGGKREIREFNTNGLKDGEPLKIEICK